MIKNPSVDEQRCKGLITHGRWSQQFDTSDKNIHWQPFGCKLHQYDDNTVSKCLADQTLYFVGDSTIRQLFWATAYKLGGEEARKESKDSPKHADLLYHRDGASLQYRWDPFLNKTDTLELLQDLDHHAHPQSLNGHKDSSHTDNAGILLGSGLWHARYNGLDFATEYQNVIATLTSKIPDYNETRTAAKAAVIAIPPPVLNHDWLNPERAATLTATRMAQILQALDAAEQISSMKVAWSARAMTENNSAALMSNGLHVTTDLAAHQAEVLLNRLCNNKLFGGTTKASSMCCVEQERWRPAMSILLAITMVSNTAVFFWKKIDHEQNPRGAQFQALIIFTIILCYCWVADRTTLFEKSNKIVSEKIFGLCTLAAIMIGMVHITAVPPSQEQKLPSVNRRLFQPNAGFLTRAQTEEWKGWMQVVILLYHYFGMSKTLWVYQIVRVLVASYLFLTGYGHATYFQSTKDCSLTRMFSVLLRLNLLPCSLAIVMSNDYDFYYFPGLASLWFLITFAVFWKRNRRDLSTKALILRITAAICIMHLVLNSEMVVKSFFVVLRALYGPHVNFKEFIFRVKLDIYSPFLGMLVSIARQHKVEWLWNMPYLCPPSDVTSSIRSSVILAASCALLVLYVLLARQFADKIVYNRYHSVLSILPIMAYLMARNAYQAARRYASPVFASIGTYSLELFVLQYHIWLAADTKALLRLGLVDRDGSAATGPVVRSWRFWIETLIITMVFFWLSKHCASATNTLVKWIVGKNKECCGNRGQLPSGDSTSEKASTGFSLGCLCQRRVVVVSAMLAGLWVFNVINT